MTVICQIRHTREKQGLLKQACEVTPVTVHLIRSPSLSLAFALSERNDQTEQEERREIKQRLNRKVNTLFSFYSAPGITTYNKTLYSTV